MTPSWRLASFALFFFLFFLRFPASSRRMPPALAVVSAISCAKAAREATREVSSVARAGDVRVPRTTGAGPGECMTKRWRTGSDQTNRL